MPSRRQCQRQRRLAYFAAAPQPMQNTRDPQDPPDADEFPAMAARQAAALYIADGTLRHAYGPPVVSDVAEHVRRVIDAHAARRGVGLAQRLIAKLAALLSPLTP